MVENQGCYISDLEVGIVLENMPRIRITEDELSRDTHAVLAKVQGV